MDGQKDECIHGQNRLSYCSINLEGGGGHCFINEEYKIITILTRQHTCIAYLQIICTLID